MFSRAAACPADLSGRLPAPPNSSTTRRGTSQLGGAGPSPTLPCQRLEPGSDLSSPWTPRGLLRPCEQVPRVVSGHRPERSLHIRPSRGASGPVLWAGPWGHAPNVTMGPVGPARKGHEPRPLGWWGPVFPEVDGGPMCPGPKQDSRQWGHRPSSSGFPPASLHSAGRAPRRPGLAADACPAASIPGQEAA